MHYSACGTFSGCDAESRVKDDVVCFGELRRFIFLLCSLFMDGHVQKYVGRKSGCEKNVGNEARGGVRINKMAERGRQR